MVTGVLPASAAWKVSGAVPELALAATRATTVLKVGGAGLIEAVALPGTLAVKVPSLAAVTVGTTTGWVPSGCASCRAKVPAVGVFVTAPEGAVPSWFRTPVTLNAAPGACFGTAVKSTPSLLRKKVPSPAGAGSPSTVNLAVMSPEGHAGLGAMSKSQLLSLVRNEASSSAPGILVPDSSKKETWITDDEVMSSPLMAKMPKPQSDL